MTSSPIANFGDDLLPDYEDAKSRSEIGKNNDRDYERRLREFQSWLEDVERRDGLSAAFRAFYEQQTDGGFVRAVLPGVTWFQQYGEHGAFLLGQTNLGRRERDTGAGRTDPPPGVRTRNTLDLNCFLDKDNVRWQQRGIQLPYSLTINGRAYNAYVNPFGIMPMHMTIASSLHQPQSWQLDNAGRAMTKDGRVDKMRWIVEDVSALVARLETFVVFYNGPGAGASIPQHLHYHCFEVPPGHGLFPLQHAAMLSRARDYRPEVNGDRGHHETVVVNSGYPLPAFRLSGHKGAVINSAVSLLSEWDELNGEAASANVAAITEHGEVAVYVVPRNKFFSRSPGLAGIVGGLEALGELVFTTEDEVCAIASQRVDYRYMWRVLEAVRPPNLAALGRLTRTLTGVDEAAPTTEAM